MSDQTMIRWGTVNVRQASDGHYSKGGGVQSRTTPLKEQLQSNYMIDELYTRIIYKQKCATLGIR